jgi:hypothetical protein
MAPNPVVGTDTDVDCEPTGTIVGWRESSVPVMLPMSVLPRIGRGFPTVVGAGLNGPVRTELVTVAEVPKSAELEEMENFSLTVPGVPR